MLSATVLGIYKYQKYVIEKQDQQLEQLARDLQSTKKFSEGTSKLMAKYIDNSTKETTKTQELVNTIPRVEAIAAKKPNILANKIEEAYKNFHKEKACYSGNLEACVGLVE